MPTFVKNVTASDISGGGALLHTQIIHGLIESVTIDRTDATIVDLDEVSPPARKIIDVASGTSDITLYPRVLETDNTGANLTTHTRFYVDGKLAVTATNPVVITVVVIE